MELLLSVVLFALLVGLIVLYVYAFVLLWRDDRFGDGFKLGGTIIFLIIGVAAYVYLLYRVFRNNKE